MNPFDKPPPTPARRCAQCKTQYPATVRGDYCARCDRERSINRWKEKPAVEWDGKYPIMDYWEGVYLMREEDLHEYLYQEDLKLEDLCLASCCPNNGREFSIFEFLEDQLGVDQVLEGEEEINKIVNDWIAARAPFSWSANNDRLCLDSVRRQLTEPLEEDTLP